MAYSIIANLALNNVDFKKAFGTSNNFGVSYTLLKILGSSIIGKKSSDIFREHTKLKHSLQIIIIPFEDKMNLESERLEQCTGHFAYVDPVTDKVQTVPTCAWPLFKHDMMKSIMDSYNQVPAPSK